jgi:hypothetical protein
MTDPITMADAITSAGCDPEWLCSQLEAWPRIVDPKKPTNAEHLMESAAIMLRTMLAVQVTPPPPPYRVPTGDFMCHNCKRVAKNLVVAPRRCGHCSCRDFSALPPSTAKAAS